MASNAERFLSLYEQRKKKKKETDTENISARERFLSLYEERVAPKRAFDWFSKSNAILEEVNSQYKGNADERFYDPDKYDIDSLLDLAEITRSYLDTRKSDKDFDYETYSAAADRLTAALGDIKAGTYGQNRYEYDGKEYTRAQLEDMAEESKTKAKESKQWYHNIPLVGDLIGGFTDDYQSPDLGKTSNQEYKEAVKKGELVKGYIADIDKYKMSQYYEALQEEPDFEEKSGYVSTKNTNWWSRLFSQYGLGYGDVGYEYINNINDARGKIARAARAVGADAAGAGRDPASPFEKKGYDYIEDDEVKTYNYLYQTKGKDEAEKYIDSLNLTERMTSDYKEKMSGFAEEHPILASIASVLVGGEGWKGYVKSAADYIAGNGIDENSYYSLGTNLSQSARDSVSQDMGGVGKFLYGTGMSMADFLYTTATSAGNSYLSIAKLGGNAANSTIISAKERGLNDSQALLLGTVAGAAEAITEKFSIDALLDATGMGKNAVQYLLKNILTEGSEEVSSSVINLVADTLISKDKSEWKLAMQGYVDSGDDEKTAFWKAMGDQAGQIGLDFLGGALSGGVLAGGAVGLNTAVNSNTNVGREISSNPARLAEVMDMAQNFEPVTDAYQLAQQIAEEQQQGKKVNTRKVGQLAQMVGKQYGQNLSKAAKPTETAVTPPTRGETEQTDNITTEGQNAAQERTGKATRAAATIGGEKVEVRGIASVDNDTAYVELDNGGTADIDDISFSNSQIERVYAVASNYETNGAKAVVAGYDGNIPVDVYVKAARQYYTAGLVGLPIENVAQDGYGKYIADLATRQSLYQAGMLDAQAKTAAELDALKQAKKPVSKQFGVRHEYTAELDDNQKQQIEILDVVGRLFNVSIVVKDEIAGGFSNGLYDGKNSVIEIALDDVSQAYLRIAGHELTHYIQNWSPAKYKLFRDFVVRALIEKHGQEAFNQLVQDTILQYGTQASQKLTKQQAIDEIVANSAEMFLNNPELINDIVNKDKSLAQKIIDFFKGFIAKLESAFKNITANSAEAKALSEDINTLKQAQKLWSDALRDAAAQVESKQAEDDILWLDEIEGEEAEAAGSDDYELIYSLKDSIAREYTELSKLRQERNTLDKKQRELKESKEFTKLIDKIAKAGDYDSAIAELAEYEKTSGLAEVTRDLKATIQKIERIEAGIAKLEKDAADETIKKSGLSAAEYHRKEAVKEFGYTPYFYDAGYILANGKMLNFSGDKGRHFGTRGQDHRAIGAVFDGVDSGSEAMVAFMQEGNVRIMAESPGIDLGLVKPTAEQKATIRKFISEYANKKYFYVDFTNEKGYSIGSYEYEGEIDSSKVMADIDYFYENGKVREQMRPSDFRYSLKDSTGRKLTPEQAEYFKDSKVRDADGNLLVLYHGTNKALFSTFDTDMIFATDSITTADAYAGNAGIVEPRNIVDTRIYKKPMPEVLKFLESNGEKYVKATFADLKTDLYNRSTNEYTGIDTDKLKSLIQQMDTSNSSKDEKRLHKIAQELLKIAGKFKNRAIAQSDLSEYLKLRAEAENVIKSQADYRMASKLSKLYKRELGASEYLSYDTPISAFSDDSAYKMDESWIVRSSDEVRKRSREVLNWKYRRSGVYAIYMNAKNLFVVDAKGQGFRGFDTPYGTMSTDSAAKYAKENGFDGALIKNVYDTGRDDVYEVSNVYVAFSPEQVKSVDNLNPTSDPDIRYSLKGVEWTDYKELYNNSEKNNKALEETIAALKDEFKIFDYRRPNMKHVRKLANKLLKEYSSDYNVDELTANLAALFNYIANGEAQSYDDVMTAASAIAKNIIDKSSFKMDNGEGLDEFRKYVWSTPIKFTTIQKEEVKRLTGQNFMQWSMGKFKAVSDTNKKGIPLDSVWPELCEMSLGMLDPDTNEGDMPFALAEAMEKAADSSVDFTLEEMIDEGMHPLAECYGMTMGETLIYTANKIFDTYLSIPEVHTFAEKQQIKFDKMQDKYKEKIAALRDSFREEKAALKEKYKGEYKEKIEKDKQKREERADVKKYKAQIQKIAESLSDKLLNPKEKSYVPDNLRKAVADVLLLIDFETGRKAPDGGDTQVTLKLRKLKDAYEKIKNDDSHELHRFYNDDIEVALAELAEITEGKRINQLSYDELTDVMNIVKYFNHVISNENKMFNENLKEQRHELGENALSEIRKAKAMKQMSAVKNNRALSSFVELVRTGAMKPHYFFNRIGGTVQRLYSEMRKGEFKWVDHIEKSRAFAKEQMKRYNYQKWSTTEKSTFTTERGDKIQLTIGEKLYLYMLYRRPQGQEHITIGGVVLDEAVKEVKSKLGIKYEVKDTIPVQFTINDMQKISELLTVEQREFAEVMGKYLSDTCGSWGNEVTNKLFGFSVFTDPNYIPINSAKNYLFQKAGVSSDIRLKRKGFTKSTVPHANNPVVVSDFMRVWAQHVNDMAMYNSFVPQIEDFTQIWNYKQKAGANAESVHALIERGYGKEANEYIKNLLNDLNGGVIRPRGEGLFSSFLSLMKKSAVFASLSVSIQQVSSLPRAFAVIEPQYFVNSDKLSYKELKKWAPIAAIKQWGYFDTHMGRSVTDLLIEPEYESKAEQVKALFKDRNRRDEAFAWLPQKMDEIAWSMIWNAAKRKVLDINPNLKEGSDEHMNAAAELFTETIDKTQVVDSVFQRAEIMRSNSAALRTATLFMAEPLTYYNMLVDAGLDKNKGNRARIISSVVTAMVLNSALAAIVYAMRDDDEDKTYGEKYKAEFFEGLIDAPLSMLPYVKDVYSLVQGYTPKRPELQPINDLYYRIKRIGSDKYTAFEKIRGITEALTAFKGIPLKNIDRDIEAIFDTSVNALRNAGIIDDPKADPAKAFELAKEKYDIHKRDANGSLNAAISSVFYDIAYAAKEKGDKATYDSVKRYLLNSGRKASDFENAMQNREIKKLKEDERITEAAQAEIDKDFHRRMEILKQFITEGHKKDTVIKAISQEVSRLHKENAPDAEEFIEAYKTGDRSKWYPLYTRLKLAGWSHNDIIALIK